MRSSIYTLYLACLKYKANLVPANQKAKKYLSLSISVSADVAAHKKNINFRYIHELVSATKFFIEKWKNKTYNIST